MSTRASGDDALERTTSLPASSACTLCGWFKRIAEVAASFDTCFDFEDGSGDGSFVGIGADAVSWFISDDQTGTLPGPNVDAWFFVAMTIASGTNHRFYARIEGQNSLDESGLVVCASSLTINQMHVANDGFGEAYNGEIRYVRCWDRVLSSAELLEESTSATAVSTTNLNADYPFASAATALDDASANNRDLTLATGTLADGASEPSISLVAPFTIIGQLTQGLIARQQRYPRR